MGPTSVSEASAEPRTTASPSLATRVAAATTPFPLTQPPEALIDAMAGHEVAILGEYHLLRQHHDLVMATLAALHARGTRWLLLESFHAQGDRADRYVRGEAATLPPATATYLGYLLAQLRAFNANTASTEHLRVAFIDIDHQPAALPVVLAQDAADGTAPAEAVSFLVEIGWDVDGALTTQEAAFGTRWRADPKRYRAALETLVSAAEADAHAILLEQARIALRSLDIRSIWETQGENAAHPAREEVIKSLVGARIAASDATVLINIGGFHAQRRHVMGTPKRWLAEQLADPDSAAHGSVYSVFVNVAHAEQWTGSEVRTLQIDLDEPDELMSWMASVDRTRPVYLPLRELVLGDTPIRVNYLYQPVEHRPQEQFDAYVLLPKGELLPGFRP